MSTFHISCSIFSIGQTSCFMGGGGGGGPHMGLGRVEVESGVIGKWWCGYIMTNNWYQYSWVLYLNT